MKIQSVLTIIILSLSLSITSTLLGGDVVVIKKSSDSTGSIKGVFFDETIDDNLKPVPSKVQRKKSFRSYKKKRVYKRFSSSTPKKNKRYKRKNISRIDVLQKLRRSDKRWYLTTYRIRRGDNLWKISKRFGVKKSYIISLNKLRNPGSLSVGKRLKIPSRVGRYHRVRKGDTLSKISKIYRVPSQKIRSANFIRNNKIYRGKKIFIPGAMRTIEAKTYKNAKIPRRGYEYYAFKKLRKGKGTRFIWPIKGVITSGFGNRRDPFTGKRKFHCGIDIGAFVGTAVNASASGKVTFSGWKSPYGNMVIVSHRGGYITVYAHNKKLLVKKGDRVKQGQRIALSGKTGAVTGAHLHFEIRKYVTPLNPMRMLKK